ncbi:MAG: molybdopterin molybdotransferase MoeA [Hyphomicrobiaceae bacterium]
MVKKLLDDCFAFDADRLPHAAAIALLQARVRPVVGAESVMLAHACGRILAVPVAAPRPVPAHTNAAVDGFAFRYADYNPNTGTAFPVAGRTAAGHPLSETPGPRTAVGIFTGAIMPEGFDTVVMHEDSRMTAGLDGSCVVNVPAGLKAHANVRKAGEDVARGEVLFDVGHSVRPQDVAALASLGTAEVSCFRRLRVAVVSSGDEIVRAAGQSFEAGAVYDANAPMLMALVQLAGAAAEDLGVWPDRADIAQSRLADAAQRFDAVVTSGGASRGEEDHMAAALAARGRCHLWQLAIKPGRPMFFGQIGDTVVLGLPGNPVAVFVCFLMYAWPLLRRLGGAPWSEPRRLRLPAAFTVANRKTGRREFWRGRFVEVEGALAVEKYARDGSGLVSSLRAADGLIDIDEEVTEVRRGDAVNFIPFGEFGIFGR